MRLSPLIRRLSILLLLLGPTTASAIFEDTISHVAPTLNSGIGGAEFGNIFLVMIQSFLGVVNVVGIFMIVRAGLTLTASQEEGQMEKTKKTIGAVAASLIIINLAPRVAQAFMAYQGGGAAILESEIQGLLNFVESVAAITAIIFIIVSGIRAVASYGGGDGMEHLKRVILSVGAGLLLIALKLLVLDAVIIERTPSGLVVAIARIVRAILAMGAFVATIVLIYAGLLMIINIGKDEQYTRAKSLVLRVGIGLLVILTSMAIVQFVIV